MGTSGIACWGLILGLAGALLCPPVSARDDDAADEPVFDLAEGITPPRIIHQVAPAPNPGSRGVKIAGTVGISLVVSSRGLPKNLRVVRSLDKDVDQSALEAVAQWRFDPARKDDHPVAVRVTLEIRFHDM